MDCSLLKIKSVASSTSSHKAIGTALSLLLKKKTSVMGQDIPSLITINDFEPEVIRQLTYLDSTNRTT